MTGNSQPKPGQKRPQSSQDPANNSGDETSTQKPYELIPFPQEKPSLKPPAGHQKFIADRLHGTLFLQLTVQTAVHISTGVVAMGSDIGSRVPLIKTMTVNNEQRLSIQGSSLKGCIRAIYETITNSTLAVVTSKYKSKIPEERLPCQKKEQLCPARQIFGSMGYQALVEFNDAKCESDGFSVGFMPSLYSPQPDKKDEREPYFDSREEVAGRKFYYNMIRAIDKGEKQGFSVQQAGKSYTFTTKIQFKNLTLAELGTLLIALGQDSNYPMALKVGGGKPIGMGTMTVDVTAIERYQGLKSLRDRYSSYSLPESDHVIGEELQTLIQKTTKLAHKNLIQKNQLEQLAQVLSYPTDRQPPPEGTY